MMADGSIVTKEDAMRVPATHYVNGNPLVAPFPAGLELAMFAMGCFWGAERTFWKTPGVFSTAVGYAGGVTPDPDYGAVCTGLTGHAEVVRVVFDPARVSYASTTSSISPRTPEATAGSAARASFARRAPSLEPAASASCAIRDHCESAYPFRKNVRGGG
jgi:hypothetical protein